MRVRCPYCQSPVEVADEHSLSDICCSSCGSAFSLVSDPNTATTEYVPLRRIGHFELTEQLGVGAFGSVWKARDTQLDRLVAVKIPRKSQLDAAEIEQFLREARAAAQLQHPRIVRLYEVGREGDTVYIVSDLVQGVTLGDWLSGQQPSPREAAELCVQMTDALEHAHAKGVIHRDLKPGNIMLNGDGQAFLMDFGLAKREAGEVTVTYEGRVLGTPAYMSPEQARGEGHHVDGRTDVYSLGVVLFQLLTGELPFRGTPRMLLHQVLTEEPRSPRTLNDRVPRDLETICLKAMAKDPARRYATATEMGADLRRYLAGQPIHARPFGRAEKAWRWCRRNPALATLSGAVVLLLSLVAVTASIAALRVTASRDEAARERDSAREALLSEAQQRRLADEASQLAEQRRAEAERSETSAKVAAEGEANQRAEADRQRQAAVEQAGRAERSRYLADVAAAQQAYNDGNLTQVLDILQAQQPRSGQADQRGFESRYLFRASIDNHRTLRGHVEFITDLAISPDGSLAVSSAADTTVRFWNLASGDGGLVRADPLGAAVDVEFSPDGKLLAIAAAEKIWVLEAGTWKERCVLSGHRLGLTQVAFFPDSRRLASVALDQTLRIWDTEKGQIAEGFSTGGYQQPAPARAVAVSPDGKTIAVGTGQPFGWSTNLVRLFDVEGRKFVKNLRGHADAVYSLVYSADGKLLASGSGDWTVRLWDMEKREPLRILRGHNGGVNSVAFSPDGKNLVSASGDRTVMRWRTDTGDHLSTLRGHTGSVVAAQFLADAHTLVSASSDKTIKVWNVELDDFVRLDPRQTKTTAPSRDNKEAAKSTAPKASILGSAAPPDADSSAEGTVIVTSIDFSADSKRMVMANSPFSKPGSIHVWDVPGRKLLHTWTGRVGTASITSRLSPNGRLLAVAESYAIPFANVALPSNFKAKVTLYDFETFAELRQWDAETELVLSLCFSPDGSQLVGGQNKGRVTLWNTDSGSVVSTKTFGGNPITAAAIAPDGKTVAVASIDGVVRLLDLPQLLEATTLAARESIFTLAFSPNGQVLASGGSSSTMFSAPKYVAGGTIRLWDLKTRSSAVEMTAHTQFVRELRFVDEDKQATTRLLSAALDGTARLWDTESRRELLILRGDRSAYTATLSPDGKTIAVGYDDGSARLWSSELSAEATLVWEERELAGCIARQAWSEAIEHLDRLIAARPHEGALRFSKARMYWETDDMDRATATWQESKDKLSPAQLEAGFGQWIGSMFIEAGDHQQRREFERTTRNFELMATTFRLSSQTENPVAADVICRLGNCYAFLLGDAERALPQYQESTAIQRKLKGKAWLLDPSGQLAYVGRVFYETGDYDRAGPALEESLATRQEVFGDGEQVFLVVRLLAALRRDQGRLAEARQHFERLIDLRSKVDIGPILVHELEGQYRSLLRQMGATGDQPAVDALVPASTPPTPLRADQVSAPAGAPQQGVTIRYFNDFELAHQVVERVEPRLDVYMSGDTPDPLVSSRQFSTRWTGWLKPPRAGKYRFTCVFMGGARLWIGEKLLIDRWSDLSLYEKYSAEVELSDEPCFVQFDYHSKHGAAMAKLIWLLPGETDTTTIPASCWFTSRESAAQASAPPAVAGDANPHGLLAELFRGAKFQKSVTRRIDPQVDWHWSFDAPAPEMPADYFSIRWTGKLLVPTDGQYVLRIHGDDGFRAWIDDKPLIDVFHGGPNYTAVTRELSAGAHDLKLEYCEHLGSAWITLRWAREGDAHDEVVPRSALIPAE